MVSRHTCCVTVNSEGVGFRALHFAIHRNGESEPLHGHRYRLAVTVHGPLSPDGYVLDFSALKDVVRQVCAPLDRKFLLPGGTETIAIEYGDTTVTVRHRQRTYSFPAAEVVVLPLRNTTTELLARYLGDEMLERLRKLAPAIAAVELRLEESEGQSATVRITPPDTLSQEIHSGQRHR